MNTSVWDMEAAGFFSTTKFWMIKLSLNIHCAQRALPLAKQYYLLSQLTDCLLTTSPSSPIFFFPFCFSYEFAERGWGSSRHQYSEMYLFQLMSKTRLLIIYTGGPQSPGHGVVQVHGLLTTRLHSRGWAQASERSCICYLQSLPIACITAWALPSVKSVAALDSHRITTVNCTWEGSRWRVPCENLMPDDLRWSWGGDASTGGRLPLSPIIPRWDCLDARRQAQGSHSFCIMMSCVIISLYVTM